MLNLQKGESVILDLKKSTREKLNIGLGWDTRADLDVHAVLRNKEGNKISTVYYGRKSSMGVRLSGDNTTGVGDGDDEIIYLDLDKIDKSIAYISIYVNVFSSGLTFGDVKGSYIRLFDPNTEETFAKSKLDMKNFANYKTVHFAEIAMDDLMDFKIIMEGGKCGVSGMPYNKKCIDDSDVSSNAAYVENEPVEVNTAKPKRKKFLGIF